jgi:tetratricopeptide (TPR) repeat protein
VLLYELLTSTTPFDTNALLKAGLDEVRRVIRNEEPLRPSARLGTMLAANLTTVASSRQVNPPRLIRTVRGDLDWIVMKALEKDRTRRYETASGLALDVQHYLASEPISARPPSALYKFRKALLRNKLMSVGISIILLLLIAGLIGATWLLRRERDARRDADAAKLQAEADKGKAQLEAARSGQVTRFLEEMLEAVEPSVARGRDTTMLREILDRTAERVGVELKDQPPVEAELRNRIGSVYEKLGFYAQSETMLREALAIRRKHFGEDSLEAAESMSELSRALLMQEKSAEAVDLGRAALAARQNHLGNEDPQVAASLDLLGQALWLHHKLPDAEATMRQSLALRQKLLGDEHPDVATSINGLGNVLYEQKRYREAEPLFRQALHIWQKTLGNEHQNTCSGFQNLASVLYQLRDFGEAEVVARDLVAKRRKLVGNQHPSYSRSLSVLADILMQQFKWGEAEETYRELLPLEEKFLGVDNPDLYRIRGNLVFVIKMGHKFEEAERLLNDLLTPELVEKPQIAPVLLQRAEFLARRGRWKDAAADASKALQHQKGDHQYYHALAPLLVIQGDVAGYRQICREITARFGGTSDQYVADRMAKDCLILPHPDLDLKAIAKLADLAVTKGQGEAALPMFQLCKSLAEYREGHFEGAIEWAQKALQSNSPIVKAETFPVCAMAYYRLGRTAEARSALAKGAEMTNGKIPDAKGSDLGVDWRDWIVAHSLMIEARNLIEGAPDSTVEPTGNK